MTKRGDDEEEELQRQREERKKMRPVDRVYDEEPTYTAAGDMHAGSRKRSGRKYPSCFRMTLTTRAVLVAIRERDGIPSDPVLLEVLIEAYLAKYREPPIVIPTEEVLIEQFEKQRDRRYAKKRGK